MNIFERPGQLDNDKVMSTHELLARKRILCLYGIISDYGSGYTSRADMFSCFNIADTLLALDAEKVAPIRLFIDSPGGLVSSGMMLIDIIKLIKSPVYTIGKSCQSMAALVLASGEPGHRYVLPHARVMLHLPWGGTSGDAREIEIQAKEMNVLKEQLVQILIENGVRKTKKKILEDIDREFWMNAGEAIKYGVADEVLTREALFSEDFEESDVVSELKVPAKKAKAKKQ